MLIRIPEAAWGADPLEYLGGFRSLSYDETALFKSSLATNGTAKWSLAHGDTSRSSANSAHVALNVEFPNIDWVFLQAVYGWAALQFQGWARGDIIVQGEESKTILLDTQLILEFWVDGESYFGGDFYGYRKTPLVLDLEPGRHTIDLRLIRDVRAMGGVGKPIIEVEINASIASNTVEVINNHLTISDVVDGSLPVPLASVAVRNNGRNDIEIFGISSKEVCNPFVIASKLTRH